MKIKLTRRTEHLGPQDHHKIPHEGHFQTIQIEAKSTKQATCSMDVIDHKMKVVVVNHQLEVLDPPTGNAARMPEFVQLVQQQMGERGGRSGLRMPRIRQVVADSPAVTDHTDQA